MKKYKCLCCGERWCSSFKDICNICYAESRIMRVSWEDLKIILNERKTKEKGGWS
jgi:hypothetical protein